MTTWWLGLLALVGLVNAKSYSIVVPQKIVPGQPLPVSCNFLTDADVEVQIDLLKDARTPITTVVHTFKKGESGVLTLDVPSDLPYQPRYNLLVHGLSGVYFFRNHDLVYELATVKENLELFIQTDRALYKPGQPVRFRAFGMFTDMLVDTQPLNITIRDPKNNMIRKWTNITNPEYGVVESYLELDTEPVLGDWTIQVVARDPYDVIIRKTKTFTVGQYVLPTFEVTVTMPTFILTSDKEVQINVKATYTYGKPVNGTMIVRADLSYPNTPWQNHKNEVMVETNVTIDGEIDVTIPLSRIANEYDPNTFVPLLSKLAGHKLTIDAIVTESINGQVRHGYGDTQFYDAPFMLKFTDDHLTYFKPGLPFRASVHVAQADGRPVISSLIDLVLKPYIKFRDTTVNSGYRARALVEQRFAPPSGGILDVAVDVPMDAKTLHLLVEYRGISTSLDVDITPQLRNGTIQLTMESASAAINKEVEFKVNCTEGIETLQYMVMANDHAVHSGVVPMNGQKTTNFRFTVTKLMEPYAQLVVFYFNKDSIWNADSVLFEINDGSAIFRNNVSLSYNVSTAEPGEHVQLSVDTAAFSMVNVLAVDQSVILMKTGNDLTTQDVTSALAVHGPSTSYTNIHVADHVLSYRSDLEVLSDIGPWTAPFKRQVDCVTYPPGLYPTALPIMPTAVPGFPSGGGAAGGQLPGMYPSAAPGMTYPPGLFPTAVAMSTPAGMPGPGGNNQLKAVQHIRSKFPETFIWMNTTSDNQGRADITAEVPDTITSWVASAFSVSKMLGLGIADTKASFKSFRPFFVSLNLPYSVIHGEELVLQANVFNYLQQDLQVRVTLAQSAFFKVIIPGQPVHNRTMVSMDVVKDISVPAGTAKSVFIPILPDKIGQIDLLVKAQSSMSADAVRRQLKVKPEGFEMEYNRPMIVSAGDHVNMTLETPKGTVPGSQIVHVSAIADIMGPSIPNMNRMLRLPTGCGEQTIATMAPDIVITKYLESSHRMTEEIRNQAISFMEKGVQRELNFQRFDGSFSIWGDSDHTGSTWLTAFVLKTFGEAGEYIQVPDLTSSMYWLYRNQRSDGSFNRLGFVHDYSLRGGASTSYSLTAFVTIAVSKYDSTYSANDYYSRTILTRARRYLENHVVNMTSPYELAITSYALRLAGSVHEADQAFIALDAQFAVTKDGLKYWTEDPVGTIVQPMRHWEFSEYRRPIEIETAGYALLYLSNSYHQLSNNVPALKWLLSKRNANGGFSSTQDTVVGLDALSRYQQLFGPPNLNIAVTAGPTFTSNLHVTTADSLVLKTTRVPESEWTTVTNATLPVTLTATGSGSALAQVSVSYHVKEDSIKPTFNVSTNIVKETLRSLDLTIQIYREMSANSSLVVGMTVVEVSIPSGFMLMPDTACPDISRNCKKLEQKEGKIVVYFDDLYLSEVLDVSLIRTDLVAKTQPAAITVYNYYKPYLRGLGFYESKLLSDSTFCDICTDCGC